MRNSQSKNLKNVPKKKLGAQQLRRADPKFQKTTADILSLLNENRETASFPAASKTLEKHLSIVTSVTVGESINFSQVLSAIQGYDYEVVIPEEVINIEDGPKKLMVLSNGTLVGWNLSEDEIVSTYVPLLGNSIESKYNLFESEELDWIELKTLPENPSYKGNSYLHGEIMVIQGSTIEKRLLDMAAFAVGISRSTRLSVLEDQLEEHLALTKQNSEVLAMGTRITTSEHEFLQLAGRLFLLRGKLNLYSELIDTPDLYWTEPALEKIYESVSKILDINSRIAILNRKLDYATEEQRAFLSVLNERKSARLEWIIIWLIMVEVCFETFHFYERYLDKKESEADK
ncbi:uncharacterized protein SPAPADRAFT_72276 [Spathaspora passalidarum NRRL Y-27907]|uniref:DUF155 domain-containing protein n=1 Tax=Spathaspora passalidarum (strain NRRL Y-27907 / 11-Y1) TaxID=619300 RepID=G3AQC7_SPAPN|nr:uncharacterized protein SPAPADRAFT_72276 [Spathaspora passalidarum NRRL Y-27907]EGW31474.1 hypothetical protein SPAPADRAFT_72276 [Spathaspora passalidarum NRRL Y-27907]